MTTLEHLLHVGAQDLPISNSAAVLPMGLVVAVESSQVAETQLPLILSLVGKETEVWSKVLLGSQEQIQKYLIFEADWVSVRLLYRPTTSKRTKTISLLQ